MPLEDLKTPPIAVGRFEGDRFVADAETFENFAVYYSAFMIENQKKNREQFQDNFLRRSPRLAKQKFSAQDDKPEKSMAKKQRRLSIVSDSEPVAATPVMQLTELKRKRRSELETVIWKKSKTESENKASDTSGDKRRQTVKKLFGMPRRGQRRNGIDQRPPELDNLDDDVEENSIQEPMEVAPQICENPDQLPACSSEVVIQDAANLPVGDQPESHRDAADYDQYFHIDYLKETERLVDMVNHNLPESPDSPSPVPDQLFNAILNEHLKTPASHPDQVVQKPGVSNLIHDISDNSETLSTTVFGDETIEMSSDQIGSAQRSEISHFHEIKRAGNELPFESDNLSVISSSPSRASSPVEEQPLREDENVQRVDELSFEAQVEPLILIENANSFTSHPSSPVGGQSINDPEGLKRNHELSFEAQIRNSSPLQLISSNQNINEDENVQRNNPELSFESQGRSFLSQQNSSAEVLIVQEDNHELPFQAQVRNSPPLQPIASNQITNEDENVQKNNPELSFESQDRSFPSQQNSPAEVLIIQEDNQELPFEAQIRNSPPLQPIASNQFINEDASFEAQDHSSPSQQNSPAEVHLDQEDENIEIDNHGLSYNADNQSSVGELNPIEVEIPNSENQEVLFVPVLREEAASQMFQPISPIVGKTTNEEINMESNNNKSPFETKNLQTFLIEQSKASTSQRNSLVYEQDTTDENILETVQIRQEVITPESSHTESKPSSGNTTPAPCPVENEAFEPQFEQQPRFIHDYTPFPTNPIPPPTYSSMRPPSLTPESPTYSPVPEMPQISQQAYNCQIEMHNLHPTAVIGGKFMLTGEVEAKFGGTSIIATMSFLFQSDSELTSFENHFFGHPIYSVYLQNCRRNFNCTPFQNKPDHPLLFPPVQLPSWFNPERLSRHEEASKPVPPTMPHPFPSQPDVIPPQPDVISPQPEVISPPRHATVPRQPTAVPPWTQEPSPQPTEKCIPLWLNGSRPPQQKPRPASQGFNLNGPCATSTPPPFKFNQNPNAPVDVPMPGVVPKPEEVYYPQQAYHQPESSFSPAHEKPVLDKKLPSIPCSTFPNGQIPCVPLPLPENAGDVSANQVQFPITHKNENIENNNSSDEGDKPAPTAKLAMANSHDEELQERLVCRHREQQFILSQAKQYGIFCLTPIIPALIFHRRARDISFYLQDRIAMFFCRQYYHALTIKLLPMRFGIASLGWTRSGKGNTIRLRTDLMGGGLTNKNNSSPSSIPFDQLPYVVAQDDENFYDDPRTSIIYIINRSDFNNIEVYVQTDTQPVSLPYQYLFDFLKAIPQLLRWRLMKPVTLEEIP